MRSQGRVIAMNVMYLTAIGILLLERFVDQKLTLFLVLDAAFVIAFAAEFSYGLYCYTKEKDKVTLRSTLIALGFLIWNIYDLIMSFR